MTSPGWLDENSNVALVSSVASSGPESMNVSSGTIVHRWRAGVASKLPRSLTARTSSSWSPSSRPSNRCVASQEPKSRAVERALEGDAGARWTRTRTPRSGRTVSAGGPERIVVSGTTAGVAVAIANGRQAARLAADAAGDRVVGGRDVDPDAAVEVQQADRLGSASGRSDRQTLERPVSGRGRADRRRTARRPPGSRPAAATSRRARSISRCSRAVVTVPKADRRRDRLGDRHRHVRADRRVRRAGRGDRPVVGRRRRVGVAARVDRADQQRVRADREAGELGRVLGRLRALVPRRLGAGRGVERALEDCVGLVGREAERRGRAAGDRGRGRARSSSRAASRRRSSTRG